MIEKNNTWKILRFFFVSPLKEVHLRELSREMGLSMPAVLSAVKKIKKENLVLVKKGIALTTVKANLEFKGFKWLKRAYNLESIYTSGLIDYLLKSCNPQTIICFGSYSRGEDIESSDVDIAVIGGKDLILDLTKFEKAFGRKISIHNIKLDKVSEEFRSNLYNGIVLEGAL